jgi:hypothetical protein
VLVPHFLSLAQSLMEFRDLGAAKVDHLWKGIESRFKQTDKEENVEAHCELLDENAPARSDAAIQNVIRDAANSERRIEALAAYFHSSRKATSESTRVARRAGRKQASNATPARMQETETKVAGSAGPIPNSMDR